MNIQKPSFGPQENQNATQFNMSWAYLEHLRNLFDMEHHYSVNHDYSAWLETLTSVLRAVIILGDEKEQKDLYQEWTELRKLHHRWKLHNYNTANNAKKRGIIRNPHDIELALNKFSMNCRILAQKKRTLLPTKEGMGSALTMD